MSEINRFFLCFLYLFMVMKKVRLRCIRFRMVENYKNGVSLLKLLEDILWSKFLEKVLFFIKEKSGRLSFGGVL